MDSIPIICFACDQSFNEAEYPIHMETVHGGLSQQNAMGQKKAIEQNVPKDLPPELAASLPDEDFMATLKEIEKAEREAKLKPKPQEAPKPSPSFTQTVNPVVEKKPLELKYKYEGTCDKGHEVKTIMFEADNLYATAYCVSCDEKLEQIQVEPIKETFLGVPAPETKSEAFAIARGRKKKNEQPNI